MKTAFLYAPALALVIAGGLATGANAETAVQDAQVTQILAAQQPATPRTGLRQRHDGKSGVHRTRSKINLLNPAHTLPVSAGKVRPHDSTLVERLFGN